MSIILNKKFKLFFKMIKHLVCIIAFNIIAPMVLQPLKISERCGKFLTFSMVSHIDVELIEQAVQLRGG